MSFNFLSSGKFDIFLKVCSNMLRVPGNSFQEVKLCMWSTAVFLPYYIFKCCYVTLHVFGFTWGSFTLSYTYRLTGNSLSLNYQDEFDTKIYHVLFINFIIVPLFWCVFGLVNSIHRHRCPRDWTPIIMPGSRCLYSFTHWVILAPILAFKTIFF